MRVQRQNHSSCLQHSAPTPLLVPAGRAFGPMRALRFGGLCNTVPGVLGRLAVSQNLPLSAPQLHNVTVLPPMFLSLCIQCVMRMDQPSFRRK